MSQSRLLTGPRGIRIIALAGLIAALSVCCLASPAGARVVLDKVTGKKFGIVPAPTHALNASQALSGFGAVRAATPTCDPGIDAACNGPLIYNGGDVMHGARDYLFFWAPSNLTSSWTATQTAQWNAYMKGMGTWLTDVASQNDTPGSPFSVFQQYYDKSGSGGANKFIPDEVQNAGSITDTNAAPAGQCSDSDSGTSDQIRVCLTDAQLSAELTKYVTAHNLPTGLNTEYFILTPQGIGSCDDSTSQSCAYSAYCGYHTGTFTQSNAEIIYSNLPWGYGTGCDPLGAPYVNSNFIDPVAGTFSHELSESMTDPNGDGWLGSGGGSDEIGDKCAYQYAVGQLQFGFTGLPTTAGGAPYNVTFNGDHYLIQMEYSNRDNGCELTDTDTQPSATVSVPSSVSPGSPVALSLTNVAGPAIDYVSWDFGDGSTPVTTTGTNAPPPHTYQTAGNYTVTAIITDVHGNEVKETGTVALIAAGPPVSLKAPSISGTPQQGQTLTLTQGQWTNSPTLTDQWEDCDTSGQNCSPITGATGLTYQPVASDVGQTLVVVESASNSLGPAAAPVQSAATAVVLPPAPTYVSGLAITGTAVVGNVLTVVPGTWGNNPLSFANQWYDCSASGSSCVAIPGATLTSYTLTSSDVGHELRVAEAGSNSGGPSALAVSPATSLVQPNPATVKASLTKVLVPTGIGAKIESLLANGGYGFTFQAPSGGTLRVSWKHGSTVVASFTHTFSAGGASKLKLTLGQLAKTLLAKSTTLTISATDSFTPVGGSPVSLSAPFTLRR